MILRATTVTEGARAIVWALKPGPLRLLRIHMLRWLLRHIPYEQRLEALEMSGAIKFESNGK